MTVSMEKLQRVTVALGTFVALEAMRPRAGATHPSLLDVASVLDEASEVFAQIAALMHPSLAGSDLSRIANAAANETVVLHPWTYELLAQTQRIWLASEGGFDPCLPGGAARFADLELLAADCIRCTVAPMQLDLGGIAKGFAVDKAVEVLQRHGCSSGLVNAGGDLRVFGTDPQSVYLRHSSGAFLQLQSAAAAVAVSAPRGADSPVEHRGFYSPHTGHSLSGRWVGIVAASAAVADALTKCAIVCRPNLYAKVLQEFGARELDAASLEGELPL